MEVDYVIILDSLTEGECMISIRLLDILKVTYVPDFPFLYAHILHEVKAQDWDPLAYFIQTSVFSSSKWEK